MQIGGAACRWGRQPICQAGFLRPLSCRCCVSCPKPPRSTSSGFRYVAFAIDGLLLLASIVSIAVHGFNLGIDFTGGVSLEVKSAQHIDIGQLRSGISGLGFKNPEIQYVSGGQCNVPVEYCALIRVQPQSDEADGVAVQKITAKLGSAFTIRSTSSVGPKVSSELFHAGVIATLLAVLAIGGWVAVRFEWQYGIAAALATGHDVLVTAGLFSILHLDFTLTSIAALLTLAGYSINDTVVVFDRIRENRRKYKRMGLADLINLSTNQMLTRTILTSAATNVIGQDVRTLRDDTGRDFGAELYNSALDGQITLSTGYAYPRPGSAKPEPEAPCLGRDAGAVSVSGPVPAKPPALKEEPPESAPLARPPPTPWSFRFSFRPAAMTVTRTSSPRASSMTAPKMMFASTAAELETS